jgi:hypothetical protein
MRPAGHRLREPGRDCGDGCLLGRRAVAQRADHEKRADFIRVVLDFCRLEYAIDSDLLAESRLRQSEKEFRERLKSPWSLDREEELREPRFLRLDNLNRKAGVSTTSIGPASALGKFIKLYVRQNNLIVDLRKDAYREFMLQLMAKLEEADYLRSHRARNEENAEVLIYRLRLHKLIWRLGDGVSVRTEIVKQRSYKDRSAQPNIFLQAALRARFLPDETPARRGSHRPAQY